MAVLLVRETDLSNGGSPDETTPRDALLAGETQRARSKTEGSVAAVLGICLVVAFVSQTLSYLVPAKMPYLVTAFGASSAVSGLFLGGFGAANIARSLSSARLKNDSTGRT